MRQEKLKSSDKGHALSQEPVIGTHGRGLYLDADVSGAQGINRQVAIQARSIFFTILSLFHPIEGPIDGYRYLSRLHRSLFL